MAASDQSTETQSTQSLIANASALIEQHARSAVPPKDFTNTTEYGRRMLEADQRYASDKYVAAIQSNTPFNLKETLAALPFSETPSNVHARSATIENRMLGDAAVSTERDRLTNGGERQLAFLESRSDDFKKKIAAGGAVELSDVKAAGCAAETHHLTGVDVANVAQMNGVKIAPDVLTALQGIKGSMCSVDSGAKSPASAGNAAAPAHGAAR